MGRPEKYHIEKRFLLSNLIGA